MSRVKTAEKIVWFCFLFRIFFEFWAKIFQTFGQKTSRSFQNYLLRVQRNSLWLEILRHGSQKSLLRFQSKIFGRNNFLIFLFRIFSDFERNFFQTFGEKSSKSCQNYLLRFQRNNLWLEIFFKSFESFWIFCRNLWHGSQFSIYVSRVKIAEETVFWFFFSEFFSAFERKIFQTFGQKNSKSCQNYLLRVQRNNLWLEFFLSFESFPIFCRNHWHGSQNSIYVSRVKTAEKIVCFCFLFRIFFRILSESFSDFWPKNFNKFSKLSSTCPEEQFVAWNSSAWFSKFYLRVQSKKFGRSSFLIFLSRIFSEVERNFFQTFGEKSSKSCQNYLLRVQRNNLWLEIFFKRFESFWSFCRNLWHGSQFSIYVSRVKIAEETVFWFFFSEFFRILREKFFRLSAKKLQKVVKTSFYVSRGTVCGLKFFSKVLNRFGFSAETFGMVLKILSTCPE